MKKLNLIICLFFLYSGLGIVTATTLDQYWFCRDMEVTDESNFSRPINCIGKTDMFSTTDPRMFAIVKLSNSVEGDEIRFEIRDPSGYKISGETVTALENLSVLYDYETVEIAGKNMPTGTYPVKMFINDNEVLSDEFRIYKKTPLTCSEQGFYCCPKGKTCVSAKKGTCDLGSCCASGAYCQTISPNLTRTLITNCEETGLNECSRVIRLYNYGIHGQIEPEQTVAIEFRDIDIDCYKKEDIAIAYYDETAGVWIEKNTHIEQVSENLYRAKAQINYLGYIALVRTEACVPILCTYGGYRLDPVGGYVNVKEPVTFELCGMVTECSPLKDGICNKHCPEGIDPDCDECTSEAGDCCLISYDNKCDKDCSPYVDPDCCRKSDELCCAGGSSRSDSESCDKNCDTGGAGCTGCTAAKDDCCNATSDGACDPDCPKLSNGIGYLDVDCCAEKGIPVTSDKGDCCKAEQDGVCDCDCIAGLDVDCVLSDCCGNKICASNENPSTCPSDCSCGDGICSSSGTGGETYSSCPADCYCGDEKCSSDETCSTCPADCGECSIKDGSDSY